jgi:hypothetical protein
MMGSLRGAACTGAEVAAGGGAACGAHAVIEITAISKTIKDIFVNMCFLHKILQSELIQMLHAIPCRDMTFLAKML